MLLAARCTAAAPGFFPWNPSLEAAIAAAAASAGPTPAEGAAGIDALLTLDTPNSIYSFHLQQLQKDIAQRTGGFGGLRSFLRLYTSIDLPKLAAGSGMTLEELR